MNYIINDIISTYNDNYDNRSVCQFQFAGTNLNVVLFAAVAPAAAAAAASASSLRLSQEATQFY